MAGEVPQGPGSLIQSQIYGVVENAFDKSPPVDTPSYNGINYNASYSQAGIVGRFFRIGFRFML